MTRPAPYTPESKLPEGPEILRLRAEGHTFQAIADQYGVSRQGVHKRLKDWKRKQKERNQ